MWKHSEEWGLLEQLYTEKGFNVLVHCKCYILGFMVNIHIHIYFAGDSGYTTEPWCVVLYAVAAEDSTDAHFNGVHAKARCIIKRTKGVLKAR